MKNSFKTQSIVNSSIVCMQTAARTTTQAKETKNETTPLITVTEQDVRVFKIVLDLVSKFIFAFLNTFSKALQNSDLNRDQILIFVLVGVPFFAQLAITSVYVVLVAVFLPLLVKLIEIK